MFESDDPALAPMPMRLDYRRAYYHLVNVEEHPEVLPLAFDMVSQRLRDASTAWPSADPPPASLESLPSSLESITTRLDASRNRFARPWRKDTQDLTRRQVLHYFVQFMPTALVDGCWLQCGCRVAAAHTPVGASLTGLYQHQVRAFVADPGRHFVADYRSVMTRLSAPVEEVTSHSFAERTDIREASLGLPIFLLGIAPFPQTLSGEIFGLNLAWQFLNLSAFGPDLIRDACEAYGLPRLGDDLNDPEHLETGRRMAREAALRFLETGEGPDHLDRWHAVMRGVATGVAAWTEWFDQATAAAPTGPPDPRQEMIDLLWRKAPHACGYHASKRLGATKIDDHLDPTKFDGPAILDALARSPWVKADKSGRTMLLGRLIEFGGPMLAVFSPVEQQIIQNWVDTLSSDDASQRDSPASVTSVSPPDAPTTVTHQHIEGRGWDAAQFRDRSKRLYSGCSIRELYHYLINVEFHPDILPVAERFARDRLERAMATLWKGERPIPSRRYDPASLERWVYDKHREQVASYRPPGVRPEVTKEAFIEATTQLAPLILIDGGWLQGIGSPALIHTAVGRMMFHVLVEEIGEGKPEEHHANIYRNLLTAMGETPPPVESWDFARWPRLLDESFEVPTLWLTISCFPRHFLPEILGLNLAVELAGVGGPYMEARDTLRQFRFPTLFVDVHNAADNVSVGHAAWAMNAIKRHMDEVAERDGPHSVDRVWHRVWAGARSTLPQIGRLRLMAHRIRRRFFGEDLTQVPLIFPS